MIVVLGWIAVKALFNKLGQAISAQLDHDPSITAFVGERFDEAVPRNLDHSLP